MKFSLNLAIASVIICCAGNYSSGQAQGNRYEISGFVSMFSYENNFSFQSDICGGWNFLNYWNISITGNLEYRNYSILTKDYVSCSIRKPIGNHELRLGAIAGIYTLWLCGYQAIIPCVGCEVMYSLILQPDISLRVKERICNFSDNHHNLFSTSTLIGLCFAFGNR